MIKVFLAFILSFLLIPAGSSFAQSQENVASKIYSGHLHQYNLKSQGSLWHALFGRTSPHPKEDVDQMQCSIEFKSPVPFTHQIVAQVPDELTYFIRFKTLDPGAPAGRNGNGFFKKFLIKIYTNDEEEYTIDPEAEGRQIDINDEHHIFDSYIIYLILGQDIDHLEVVSASGDDNDKYILDKLEIRNDD